MNIIYMNIIYDLQLSACVLSRTICGYDNRLFCNVPVCATLISRRSWFPCRQRIHTALLNMSSKLVWRNGLTVGAAARTLCCALGGSVASKSVVS